MSKIDELRQKLVQKKEELKKEEKINEEITKIEQTLTHTAYDVYQDPEKKGRHFLMVKVKYNPETKQAIVSDIRKFEDKTAGLSFVMDKDNREYLFNKCKSSDNE